LLTAFELVASRATKRPLPAELDAHRYIVDMAYERGLIIYSRRTLGGTSGDHALVCPPLTVTAADIAEIVAILRDTLAAFSQAFARWITD
jgi:adenosylmethionine-8-amino-7-oxononanoate aminotransferase